MERGIFEIVDTESLVPEGHLLRKIDAAVDFTKIYDMVEELYCPDNGRPSVDPVVLFKMVLIQHLYGLSSLRRTAEKVSFNIAYRWFLGYRLQEDTPHFSTISYNFRHRFTSETVDQIFEWILMEMVEAGYVAPGVVFVDGTHIKANANTKKTATVSTTDPDCGMFVKGDHKRQMAYEAHTVCDVHGVVLDVEVTPGNVHDSVPFDDLYERITKKFDSVHAFVADSAYKTPHICKLVFGDGKTLSTAYTRPKTMKGGHEWWKYVYDEYYDCILCPENHVLKYSTTNRDGYREYKSDPQVCCNCPTRHLCTKSKNFTKVVTRHIWSDYVEMAEDARCTPICQRMYKARK